MLGARGFQNGTDYVFVLLINKIYFHLGSLAVRHPERHCLVDELLQVIDSHAILSAPALCRKMPLEHDRC